MPPGRRIWCRCSMTRREPCESAPPRPTCGWSPSSPRNSKKLPAAENRRRHLAGFPGRRIEEALGEAGGGDVAVEGLAGEAFGDEGARGDQLFQIDSSAQA